MTGQPIESLIKKEEALVKDLFFSDKLKIYISPGKRNAG